MKNIANFKDHIKNLIDNVAFQDENDVSNFGYVAVNYDIDSDNQLASTYKTRHLRNSDFSYRVTLTGSDGETPLPKIDSNGLYSNYLHQYVVDSPTIKIPLPSNAEFDSICIYYMGFANSLNYSALIKPSTVDETPCKFGSIANVLTDDTLVFNLTADVLKSYEEVSVSNSEKYAFTGFIADQLGNIDLLEEAYRSDNTQDEFMNNDENSAQFSNLYNDIMLSRQYSMLTNNETSHEDSYKLLTNTASAFNNLVATLKSNTDQTNCPTDTTLDVVGISNLRHNDTTLTIRDIDKYSDTRDYGSVAIIVDASVTKFNNTVMNYYNDNVDVSLVHEKYPVITVKGTETRNIGITDFGSAVNRTVFKYYPIENDDSWFPLITTGICNTLIGEFRCNSNNVKPVPAFPEHDQYLDNNDPFINGSMIQFSNFTEAIFQPKPAIPKGMGGEGEGEGSEWADEPVSLYDDEVISLV